MPVVIQYSTFGPPDVLNVVSVPEVSPAAGGVRVRMYAASVNPTDAKIRRGELEHVFPSTFPERPGVDVAGVIDAIGPGVIGWAIGDEVFGPAVGGAYAEQVLLTHPVSKPTGVDWLTAASLPTAGETAVRAYRRLSVSAGQVIVIHGAAGGIGSIVTQLAVADGVRVIGTVGARDERTLHDLGGEPIRYGDGWVERATALAPRVDAVLDTSGHGVVPESIALTGDPTRVVTLVDGAALALGAVFTGLEPGDRAQDALELLAALAADGGLRLPIWKTYPLVEAARAHQDLEAGLNRGKIVLVSDAHRG